MAQRDSNGRFIKGQSGNPGGRPKVPLKMTEFAEKAPEELVKIARGKKCPSSVRAQIWMWLAEMVYGKPKTGVDLDASTTAMSVISFEGDLEKWSE